MNVRKSCDILVERQHWFRCQQIILVFLLLLLLGSFCFPQSIHVRHAHISVPPPPHPVEIVFCCCCYTFAFFFPIPHWYASSLTVVFVLIHFWVVVFFPLGPVEINMKIFTIANTFLHVSYVCDWKNDNIAFTYQCFFFLFFFSLSFLCLLFLFRSRDSINTS